MMVNRTTTLWDQTPSSRGATVWRQSEVLRRPLNDFTLLAFRNQLDRVGGFALKHAAELPGAGPSPEPKRPEGGRRSRPQPLVSWLPRRRAEAERTAAMAAKDNTASLCTWRWRGNTIGEQLPSHILNRAHCGRPAARRPRLSLQQKGREFPPDPSEARPFFSRHGFIARARASRAEIAQIWMGPPKYVMATGDALRHFGGMTQHQVERAIMRARHSQSPSD